MVHTRPARSSDGSTPEQDTLEEVLKRQDIETFIVAARALLKDVGGATISVAYRAELPHLLPLTVRSVKVFWVHTITV